MPGASSNGRTPALGAAHQGSSPCAPSTCETAARIAYVRSCRRIEDDASRSAGYDLIPVAGSEPDGAMPRPEICADRATHNVPNGGHCFDCHRHPVGEVRCHFCGVKREGA